MLGAAGIWGSMQFTYLAIYNTTAGNAVILQAATPVIVVLIARFYLGERLLRVQWLGVAASVLGVLLVITRGPFAMLQPAELHSGDFITLLSLCSWAVYTVYGKRVLASSSPLLATTAAYIMGTLLVLPTAAITAPLFPTPRLASLTAWTIVFYQGILGAVAHIWPGRDLHQPPADHRHRPRPALARRAHRHLARHRHPLRPGRRRPHHPLLLVEINGPAHPTNRNGDHVRDHNQSTRTRPQEDSDRAQRRSKVRGALTPRVREPVRRGGRGGCRSAKWDPLVLHAARRAANQASG